MSTILNVSGITKIYESGGKKVIGVEKVSFSVEEGKFVSIIGPSGCGKSTILRCIAGFEKMNCGQVMLEGEKVTKPGPDRFMIFQGLDQLFPWLTVEENIVFAMKSVGKVTKGMSPAEEAEHYLDLVGLSGYGGYYPYQLSGGMKQRASIARALSVKPKILLMDEPFGSLDAFSRRAMHHMVLKVWEKTGVTVIFVTHDIEEAIDLSDRILAFSPARLKADVTNPLPRPRERSHPSYRSFFLKISGLLEGAFKPDSDLKSASAPEATLAF
ncbi:MAG TPA: ABC transporter ATP-binding protein [Thermoanaerobacterales bacterium]|nr:ABC transporter ATP-binding protein [Thermoanaerobacterales bacterium]